MFSATNLVSKNPKAPQLSEIHSTTTARPFVLQEKYLQIAEKVKNFEVYEDDTWVVSFPKTGGHWVKEMVWLLGNDLNFEQAKSVDISRRIWVLETYAILKDYPYDTVSIAAKLPRPRFIHSHLPKGFLPDQIWTKRPKVIYVTRNPKDVAISYFHHLCHIEGYQGSKDDFCEDFMNGSQKYTPFFAHFLEFWSLRDNENVLFLTYEEMKRDLKAVLQKTAKFTGKTLTEDEVQFLEDHLSFDSMKNNKAVNYEEVNKRFQEISTEKDFKFIRKGKVGTFREEMSPEMIEKFDVWIEESLKDSDFKFEI